MELTKIILLMFVWPAGQDDGPPQWTNNAYLTVAECEAKAIEAKTVMREKYGSNSRIEHICFSTDDRLKE